MSESQIKPADLRSLLKQGIHLLRKAHIPSDTLAAELLLLHAAGCDRTWLYAHPEQLVPESVTQEFSRLIERRIAGEPTQHLTGHQEFWGLDFAVTPDVLIPRPETEHLIEVALDRLAVREIRAGRAPGLAGQNVTVIDIGTGSGCIAIALAKELPSAQIFATDISTAALAVAQRNATRMGFASRITFVESDLFDDVPPASQPSVTSPASVLLPALVAQPPITFDLVISNPPYISLREAHSLPPEVRDHEPPAALYGGQEGYELYGRLIPEAARHLKPGGLVVVELGHDSLAAVSPLLESSDWANLLVTNDLAGIPRVLSAERSTA